MNLAQGDTYAAAGPAPRDLHLASLFRRPAAVLAAAGAMLLTAGTLAVAAATTTPAHAQPRAGQIGYIYYHT